MDKKPEAALILTDNQVGIVESWLSSGREILKGKNKALVVQRNACLSNGDNEMAQYNEFSMGTNDDEIEEIDDVLKAIKFWRGES